MNFWCTLCFETAARPNPDRHLPRNLLRPIGLTMKGIFGKSSKNPAEIVRNLKDDLNTLEKGGDGKKQEKAQEDLSKQMMNMKSLLFGNESEQQSDIVLAQLSQEMYNSGLLLLLLRNMYRIDFEGKKDAVQIFNNILRRQIGTRTPTVEYICTKPEILFTLCKG